MQCNSCNSELSEYNVGKNINGNIEVFTISGCTNEQCSNVYKILNKERGEKALSDFSNDFIEKMKSNAKRYCDRKTYKYFKKMINDYSANEDNKKSLVVKIFKWLLTEQIDIIGMNVPYIKNKQSKLILDFYKIQLDKEANLNDWQNTLFKTSIISSLIKVFIFSILLIPIFEIKDVLFATYLYILWIFVAIFYMGIQTLSFERRIWIDICNKAFEIIEEKGHI